jgi:uncharacterized protein (DUF362 family)
MRSEIASIPISSPEDYLPAITQALDEVSAVKALADFPRIIIKPNVVNGSPPQVTTDVRCVMGIVEYLQKRLDTEIVVAEGSGEGSTLDNFRANGYEQITDKYNVEMVDLDAQLARKYSNAQAGEYKEIYLPEYLEGAALISVPPAKDHTITRVTLGLKNMIGCLPASRYSGYWSYKKSQIHAVNTDQAIADLMLYIRPHLTIIDAIVGQAGGHLSGRAPDPPIGRIIVSHDVLAADREAAWLLGHDPEKIRHFVLAERFRT